MTDAPSEPRILYIIGQLSRGGAEQQFYYLLKYLCPNARVISLTPGGYWAQPVRDLGIEVVELERRGRADFRRLWAIMREIRRYKPDIVHIFTDNVNGLYGRLAAILTGQRHVIVGERTHPGLYDPVWYIRLRSLLLNRFIAYSVANSQAARDFIINRMRVPPARGLFIPNGLEIERIQRVANDSDNPLPLDWHDKLIIGAVGNLYYVKAPDMFVRVAAQLLKTHPELRFVWVGNGELRSQVEAQIEALQLSDKILLAGERTDVPRWLSKFSIYMLLSLLEGTPNAIMEAMAIGLPVISTNVGGCPELVHDGETGYLVPVGDEQAVIDHALKLITDPALRRSMGERGREFIQSYDVHKMVAHYRDVYKQIMG